MRRGVWAVTVTPAMVLGLALDRLQGRVTAEYEIRRILPLAADHAERGPRDA